MTTKHNPQNKECLLNYTATGGVNCTCPQQTEGEKLLKTNMNAIAENQKLGSHILFQPDTLANPFALAHGLPSVSANTYQPDANTQSSFLQTIEHKCCDHCGKNGHAPHSDVCFPPNTQDDPSCCSPQRPHAVFKPDQQECRHEDYLPHIAECKPDTEGWRKDLWKLQGLSFTTPAGVLFKDNYAKKELESFIKSAEEQAHAEGFEHGTFALKGAMDSAVSQREDEILEEVEKLEKRHDSIVQLGVYDQGTTEGKLHYQREYGKQEGYNQALSDLQTIIKKRTI